MAEPDPEKEGSDVSGSEKKSKEELEKQVEEETEKIRDKLKNQGGEDKSKSVVEKSKDLKEKISSKKEVARPLTRDEIKKEVKKKNPGSSNNPDSGGSVSEEELAEIREHITDIKKVMNNFADRLESLEDRELLDELKELGLEEQLDIVRDTLQYADSDKQRERLRELQNVFDQWDKAKIPKKINYLYKQYKQLHSRLEEHSEETSELDEVKKRLKKLESEEESLASKIEKTFEDHKQKLYALRDRIDKLRDEGADISDERVKELEERIADAGGGASDEEISRLESRIDDLESRLREAKESGELEEKLDDFERRLERRIDDLPSTSIDVQNLDQATIDRIAESASNKASVEAIEEIQSRLRRLEGGGSSVDAGRLREKYDSLKKELDSWEQEVEERENQHEKKLARMDEQLSSEIQELKQDVLQKMGERYEEMEDGLDSMSEQIQHIKEDFIGDQIDMQDDVDELKKRFGEIADEFRSVRNQVLQLSKAVRYALEAED